MITDYQPYQWMQDSPRTVRVTYEPTGEYLEKVVQPDDDVWKTQRDLFRELANRRHLRSSKVCEFKEYGY